MLWAPRWYLTYDGHYHPKSVLSWVISVPAMSFVNLPPKCAIFHSIHRSTSLHSLHQFICLQKMNHFTSRCSTFFHPPPYTPSSHTTKGLNEDTTQVGNTDGLCFTHLAEHALPFTHFISSTLHHLLPVSIKTSNSYCKLLLHPS